MAEHDQDQYRVQTDTGESYGPYRLAELQQHANSGQLRPAYMIVSQTGQQWRAADLPGLIGWWPSGIQSAAPSSPGPAPNVQQAATVSRPQCPTCGQYLRWLSPSHDSPVGAYACDSCKVMFTPDQATQSSFPHGQYQQGYGNAPHSPHQAVGSTSRQSAPGYQRAAVLSSTASTGKSKSNAWWAARPLWQKVGIVAGGILLVIGVVLANEDEKEKSSSSSPSRASGNATQSKSFERSALSSQEISDAINSLAKPITNDPIMNELSRVEFTIQGSPTKWITPFVPRNSDKKLNAEGTFVRYFPLSGAHNPTDDSILYSWTVMLLLSAEPDSFSKCEQDLKKRMGEGFLFRPSDAIILAIKVDKIGAVTLNCCVNYFKENLQAKLSLSVMVGLVGNKDKVRERIQMAWVIALGLTKVKGVIFSD